MLLGGELVNRHYLGQFRARQTPVLPERVRRLRWYAADRPVLFLQYLGRPGVSAADVYCGHRLGRPAFRILTNPVWIALTAPARWVVDRFRPRVGHGRGRGNGGPPPAGVREPRRPEARTAGPAVMALPEPTDLI